MLHQPEAESTDERSNDFTNVLGEIIETNNTK